MINWLLKLVRVVLGIILLPMTFTLILLVVGICNLVGFDLELWLKETFPSFRKVMNDRKSTKNVKRVKSSNKSNRNSKRS